MTLLHGIGLWKDQKHWKFELSAATLEIIHLAYYSSDLYWLIVIHSLHISNFYFSTMNKLL